MATRSTNRGLSQSFRAAGAHEQADGGAGDHAFTPGCIRPRSVTPTSLSQLAVEQHSSALSAPGRSRRYWPFQNFNLATIVDMLGDLSEIAPIKPLRADRAFFEMVGLALSDAVAIGASIAGKIRAHDRSSSA
jgi:hypothetical protein